jgi:hypothetical protein
MAVLLVREIAPGPVFGLYGRRYLPRVGWHLPSFIDFIKLKMHSFSTCKAGILLNITKD